MSATMTRSPAVRLGRPGIARPDFERTLTDTYDPCKQAESVNLSFAHATLFWHFKFVPIFGCLWHGAGPFDAEPRVLEAALNGKVPVYVDVADPMSYLDKALAMDAVAMEANTSAVVSAGAFPGFSNILAMECVAQLRSGSA
eukprot:s389_g5.t1